MKKRLLAMLLAVLMVLSMAACGGNTASSETPSSQETASGDNDSAPAAGDKDSSTATAPADPDTEELADEQVFHYYTGNEPATLDPWMNGSGSAGILVAALHEPMLRPSMEGEGWEPGLCDSYEKDETSTVHTLHLREGAKWQDGTEIIPEDIYNSYLRVLNPELGSSIAYRYFEILNAEAYYMGEASEEDLGIQLLDGNMIQFTTEQPCDYFVDILSARYSKISGNLSVEVDGKRLTMGELSKLQKPGDRADREKFDGLRQKAFTERSEELDKLYDDLVHVRTRMAGKLGFASYTDMGYCRQGRTGYGREQVAAFRKEIERSITPVVTALYEKQCQRLGYDVLWSFDEEVSFAGDDPKLKDGSVEELFDGIFGTMSPETRVYYQDLRRCQFYDLGDRVGKIRGAYSNYVPIYEMPFIFETFDRSPGAVKTFAHECGHGLHSYLKRGEPFVESGNATSDISEIHSMAMEFFIWPYLDQLYSQEDVQKYRFFHMKNALSFLPYGAAVDEFQTEVYDHPDMTPAQRLELWKSLEKRYVPWRKYKSEGFLSQGRGWQRQTHIYKWPFYYIDYVLSQVCALQFHFFNETDQEKAWDSYLKLLRCSGFQSFDETLALAGLESPFAPGVVEKVGRQAMDFLEKMG